MAFLNAAMLERPWSQFKAVEAIPNNSLSIERGTLRGGSYMPASCAASLVSITYKHDVAMQDKYLGTVTGQELQVEVRPEPWTRLLEPVDFRVNVRLHTEALYQNAYLERLRHIAKYQLAMGIPQVRDLFAELEEPLRIGYETLYDELFSTYDDYADYGLDTFTAWAKEHSDSSSGAKDPYGRTLTWGRLLEMELTFKEVYAEVKAAVKAFVKGYWDAKPRVLSHGYSWDPMICFRALRNRPETTFRAMYPGAEEGVLTSRNAIYRTKRYRDRAAGGIKVASWLLAFIPKDKTHEYVANATRKAIDSTGVVDIPYDGPLFSGLEAYIKVLTYPADRKCYVDMSNCEKFAGSQGFSMGRVSFQVPGSNTPLLDTLSELSGWAFTTEDNMTLNIPTISLVLRMLGIRPAEIVVHGDNVAILGVDPNVKNVIEEAMGEVYTAEDLWLGHGNDRVVGLKFTKDNKSSAISLPPDTLRTIPQPWRYGPEKLSEVTSALCCRDIISRVYGGPTYIDVLKQIAERTKFEEVGSMLGHWNGLADGIEELARDEEFYESTAPRFGECRQIVMDNLKELFSV